MRSSTALPVCPIASSGRGLRRAGGVPGGKVSSPDTTLCASPLPGRAPTTVGCVLPLCPFSAAGGSESARNGELEMIVAWESRSGAGSTVLGGGIELTAAPWPPTLGGVGSPGTRVFSLPEDISIQVALRKLLKTNG